jgi:hypothetical protein
MHAMRHAMETWTRRHGMLNASHEKGCSDPTPDHAQYLHPSYV